MSQRVFICACGWRGLAVGGAACHPGRPPEQCLHCQATRFSVISEKHPQITRRCETCGKHFLGHREAKACPGRCVADLHTRHLRLGRGRAKKYLWTPERDAILRSRYDSRVRRRAAAIAQLWAWPAWVVKKRAVILGLTRPRPEEWRPWTAREVALLEEWSGERSSRWIAKRIGRSETSVILKQKRSGMSRRVRDDGYTLRDLCECFGVDHHSVERWVRLGLLAADGRRGTDRPHDVWRVKEPDIRAFIVAHPMEFRLDKVDQTWFMDLLTHGSVAPEGRTELEAAS